MTSEILGLPDGGAEETALRDIVSRGNLLSPSHIRWLFGVLDGERARRRRVEDKLRRIEKIPLQHDKTGREFISFDDLRRIINSH